MLWFTILQQSFPLPVSFSHSPLKKCDFSVFKKDSIMVTVHILKMCGLKELCACRFLRLLFLYDHAHGQLKKSASWMERSPRMTKREMISIQQSLHQIRTPLLLNEGWILNWAMSDNWLVPMPYKVLAWSSFIIGRVWTCSLWPVA